jgi:DNA-binding CsgD family transcriptional regulator/tetratricopeptide (TPR) repeat protein
MQLLERDSQLTALQEYADEARAGAGRMVLVSGEAGIGKSSLIDALERRLPDARWAWGACDGLSTPRPLGPLVDLAPALDEELDRLCRGGAARDVLFDAVLDSLGAPGADAPLTVLVIEDVHWADGATLDLLRFLGRRLRDRRALILVSYRDDALGPADALREVLGELTAQRSTRRIGLPPLSPHALETLAKDSTVEPTVLYDLTGGNPFFATEVVRSQDAELPTSVRDVVLARAARLSESARAALDAAAVVGQRVRPDLLTRVAGAAARDIDEMLTCGVIRVDGHVFAFRHELARLAIEQAIPPHRRAEAHRRILAALVDEGEPDDARLAFHAEAAGNAVAALRHALRAARQASVLGSHREALAQYERAAAYADRLDPPERASLLDALATEAALVDSSDRSIEARTAAIAVWRALGEVRREGEALSKLVVTLQSTAQGAEATATAERAVAMLEPLGDSDELARALCSLAYNRMTSNRDAEAIDLADRAILLAEQRSMPDALSDARNTKGCSLNAIGADGVPELEDAVRIAADHGLGSETGRGYANLHAVLLDALRFPEAEQAFAEGSDYCDRHDLAFWGRCLRRERIVSLQRTGRWTEALALCEEVLASQFSAWNRLQALETSAVLRARRGETGAWDLLDETSAGVLGIGEPQYLVPNAVARAEVHWLVGDVEAARAEVDKVEALADRVAPGLRGPLVAWTTRLRGAVPTPRAPVASPFRAEAEGRIDDAVREWEALGCPYEAALALAFSDDETHLREAVARLDRLGATAAVGAVRRRMRQLGIRSLPAGSRAATRANPAGLTRREQEVLELLCESLSNDQIAAQLVLSVRTVDHHVSAILGKLGVASRQLAAETARRSGLVPERSET